jgi:hypothetical protein
VKKKEQTMRCVATIMTALSLGMGIYNLMTNAGDSILLRFIVLAIVALLLIQIYILIYLLSK